MLGSIKMNTFCSIKDIVEFKIQLLRGDEILGWNPECKKRSSIKNVCKDFTDSGCRKSC